MQTRSSSSLPADTPVLLTVVPSAAPSPAPALASSLAQPVPGQPPHGHPALPRTRIPRHRKRYSFKQRTRLKAHTPPPVIKQYQWKAWKKKPEASLDTIAEAPRDNSSNQDRGTSKRGGKKQKKRASKKRKMEPKPLEEMIKSELVDEMERQHPLASLNMGTLIKNTSAALADKPNLVPEVVKCVKEAIGHIARTVRLCQRLIGQYLELLFTKGMFEERDRDWLDLICPRVGDEDDTNEVGDVVDEATVIDADIQASNQCQFMVMLLGYIYSGDLPSRSSKHGPGVIAFIDRVCALDLLPK
ncbi:hypothetical protein BGZ70_005135, partial [Mortierella alpina]